MTEESNLLTRRGRGRPRGVRGLTRGFPSATTAANLRGTRRGGSQGKIDLAVNAGNSSISTEIRGGGKSNSSVRELSPDRLTLSPDRLPPPGRLASVRTAPTGHYFLPTSSRVTLRGTQRMNFVPTVPLAHRRPQPLGHDISTRGRANTRGRGRFTPELAASGPFAYGSLSNFTPSGSMINRNDANQPIVEERKNRSDLASDFESFRDDPWAPDMIYTYDEKEDRILESDNDNYVGQDGSLLDGWRGKRDQPINFDEIVCNLNF
ncbi:11280_t:CDS:2 [Diversispora eburnea]|uniref:11280_t:CDS:1 n=1 Tax=Diversispora eburnea TaxID=1213867 RepID=A0A9N8ZDG1_9GLOM|nr:11280_t:CDS:2 [Diversispora eburnea]